MVAALYTQDVITAGLVASCIGSGVCAGQFIGSWIAVPGGMLKYKLIFISCGLCAFVAGLAGATDSQATGSALAVMGGVMVGLLEVIVSTAVTIVIDDQSEIGTAAGVFGSIRAAAGVLATGIFSTVYINKLTHFTTVDVVPALIAAGLPVTSVEPFLTALNAADLTAAEKVPGVTEKIIEVGIVTLTQSYAKTFKIGKSTLRCLFIDSQRADQSIQSQSGLVRLLSVSWLSSLPSSLQTSIICFRTM